MIYQQPTVSATSQVPWMSASAQTYYNKTWLPSVDFQLVLEVGLCDLWQGTVSLRFHSKHVLAASSCYP